MKRYKTTAFLLSLIFIFAYINYYLNKQQHISSLKKDFSNKLVNFNPKTIDFIEIHNQLNKTEDNHLVFIKKKLEWIIKRPIKTKADNFLINNFLNSLSKYQYTKTISKDNNDPQVYGLYSPKISIKLKDKKNTYFIHIGNKSTLGYNVYLAINNNDAIYMGSAYILLIANKTLFEFRDKIIAEDLTELPTKLILSRQKHPSITLLATYKGNYILKEKNLATNIHKVLNFIKSLSNLRADDFIEKPTSEEYINILSSKNSAFIVSWTNTKGSEYHLYFAIDSNGTFLASFNPNEIVYKVPIIFARTLTKSKEEFL